MAAKLRQRDRNAGMYSASSFLFFPVSSLSFLSHFSSFFFDTYLIHLVKFQPHSDQFVILNGDKKKTTTTTTKKIVGIKKNTLFYFCVFSIFQTVSIDQNVICFVPFYIMYVFFLTLHIKFAYSTYRIALRYLTLNESLRNSKMYRKLRP